MVRTAPRMSKVIPSNSPLQDAQKEASGCSEPISHLASRFLIHLIKIAADHVMRLTIIGMHIHALAAGGCGWHGFWRSGCLGQG
jgi:hypothetical protein